MSDKTPVQASGDGKSRGNSDEVGDTETHGKKGGSESNGGGYPNPHRGKEPEENSETIMGHGGQSKMAYHGTGQLGEENTGTGNENAPAKSG